MKGLQILGRTCLWFTGISIICFYPSSVQSQFLFSNLSDSQDFSGMDVTCMTKDEDGFFWFGTFNGINRFDGSSTRIWNQVHRNYPPALSERITDVLAGKDGSLYVGTENGLAKYHRYTEEWTLLDRGRKPDTLIGALSIYSLLQIPGHSLMVVTSEGLYVLEEDTLREASGKFPLLKALQGPGKLTGEIKWDETRHGIWLGTMEGLWSLDPESGDVHHAGHDPEWLPVFQEAQTISMGIDQLTGDIWWSDFKHNLMHFSVKENRVYDLSGLLESKYGWNRGWKVFVDSSSRAWFATWTSRVYVLTPDHHISMLPNESPAPYSLKGGFAYDFMEWEGDIWLCTNGGASVSLASNLVSQIVEIPGNSVAINDIGRLKDGRLILATEKGIHLFHEKDRVSHQYLPAPQDEVKGNRVFEMLEVNGEWWCATGYGIKAFHPKHVRFRTVEFPPFTEEINQHSVIELVRDHQGNIWFSGWGTYVYCYDPATHDCKRFDGQDAAQGDFGPANCVALAVDRRGRVWASYGDNGYRVYDPAKDCFLNLNRDSLLAHQVISGMGEDARGNMWMSTTRAGLFVMDSDGQIIKHLTPSEGLTLHQTSSLYIDKHQRTWFCTPESIQYIPAGSGAAFSLPYELNVSMADIWPPIWQDGDMLMIGLINRLMYIDMNRLDRMSAEIIPSLTGFRIFEKNIPVSPQEHTLTLRHNQNFFNLNYSVAQHWIAPSIRYAYMLEGFNRDWVYPGRGLNASFTNVPPGNYTFRMKATDVNGQWHEGERRIRIIIKPPFWQTWWFYTLCGIVVAWGIYRWIRYRKQEQQKKRSDQIIDYFANSVYGENTVNEICWDIARNCIVQLGFEDCTVFLWDEGQNCFEVKASLGPGNPKGIELAEPIRIPAGQLRFSQSILSGKPYASSGITDITPFRNDASELLEIVVVPILHDHAVIGAIQSLHSRPGFFTALEVKTLATIASISALKIADAQADILARENELKLLEVQRMFAESQLQTLRAQMNPHFVFNCLNSIQECIVTQKYREAALYLNRFAKLFRLVLNYSGKLLISIEEEVEVLKLYLELESMRFENGFITVFDIDPRLDAEATLLPAMFLQPIVENALWHGLMQKPDDRRMQISFRYVSDDIFACVVEDNGIGRTTSSALRQKTMAAHGYASKGLRINEERLDLWRRKGFHAVIHITDLYDDKSKPAGTRVETELSMYLET